MNKLEYAKEIVRRSAAGLFPAATMGVHGVECRYRLGDRQCFVGILIPDDKYSPAMEGAGSYAVTLMCQDSGENIIPDGVTGQMLTTLQSWHDNKASDCLVLGDPWDHDKCVAKVAEILNIDQSLLS